MIMECYYHNHLLHSPILFAVRKYDLRSNDVTANETRDFYRTLDHVVLSTTSETIHFMSPTPSPECPVTVDTLDGR